MTNRLNDRLEALERGLDRFFAMSWFWKLLERAFEYSYRETTQGVFGLFASAEEIKRAARAARDRGYTNFDCLTPFPVSGLEFDMGLRRSRLPHVAFYAGLAGLVFAFLMQLVVHAQIFGSLPYFDARPNLASYPLNLGGKPTFSWPEMIPVCFELTALFAGCAVAVTLLFLARLPNSARAPLCLDITRDKFCLWIPSDSADFSKESVIAFLNDLGASDVTALGCDA